MSHYFTNDNVKSNIKKIDAVLKGKRYSFFTDIGVFSKSGIDFGTRLLLENINNIQGKVLDVGCGYGVIGIFVRDNFDCFVDMIDINQRAIELSKKNIKLNSLEKIKVFFSDEYKNVTERYDYIITNPPIRAGKNIVYKILISAKEYLKDEGKLFFVIKKEQGAKSVIKDLNDIYIMSIISKKSGFYIISAQKKQ